MNLLAMETYVQNNSDAYYSKIEIDEALNMAQLLVKQETRYDDKVSSGVVSIVGQQEYTLPTDCIEIDEVTYDGDLLEYKELREILYMMDNITNDNIDVPDFYYIRSNTTIGFYPIPNEIKSIVYYYRAAPATLSADADIPEIPAQFHRILCYFALSEFCQKDKEFEQAVFWKKLYEIELDKMRMYLINSQPKYYNQNRYNERIL